MTQANDALREITDWKRQAQRDEDGDLTIHSQETFGAYMAEHYDVIERALKLLGKVEGLDMDELDKATRTAHLTGPDGQIITSGAKMFPLMKAAKALLGRDEK